MSDDYYKSLYYSDGGWFQNLKFFENETGQGAFEGVSLEELKWLHGRVLKEFRVRKRMAEKGSIHYGWNDGYVR